MCIALLTTSCQQDNDMTPATAVLELELSRAGRPIIATRAVDDDLTVDIYNTQGTQVSHYAPGTVPAKIVLEPGEYKLIAYSDNQSTWKTANNGRGEGCYYAEATFVMEYDKVFRLKLDVPMTNYAVSLKLPSLFSLLFTSYTFTLTSGSRTTTINEGGKAYFAAGEPFSYALRATNTDGNTHAHSAIEFTEVAAGKLFTVSYNYDSDANSGGVDIVITDDMEPDDTNIHL